MKKLACITFAAVLLGSASVAFGKAADTPFQVRYVGNLNYSDSVVDISNTGASSTVASPQNGALCANIYAISPDTGKVTGCCNCNVQPNVSIGLSVTSDILGGAVPASNASMIKILATTGAGGCTGVSATTAGTGANVLATGLVAWATTYHVILSRRYRNSVYPGYSQRCGVNRPH